MDSRLKNVKNKIAAAAKKAGRDSSEIVLIAVSKTHPIQAIQKLYELGHRDFGENYAQELIEKQKQADVLGLKDIRWHFIGHLQSNKAKLVAPLIHSLHTIDSLKTAHELQKHLQKKLMCFVEVNIDNEANKNGVSLADTRYLIQEIKTHYTQIDVQGLMCMPDPKKNALTAFHELAQTSKALGLKLLSMGMSSDYEDAIMSGSTHIRVGTALFGERSL